MTVQQQTDPYQISRKRGFFLRLAEGLADIRAGCYHYKLWIALAGEDLLDTYRRTSIGMLWAVFSFCFFVFSIMMAMGIDSAMPSHEYLAHLAAGFLVWNLITGIISESCDVFTSNKPFINGTRLPLSVYAYRLVARNFMTSGLAAIGGVLVLFYSGALNSWMVLAALPALPLYALTGLPVILLFGTLASYTHDVKQVVDNLLRALFFLTPIIWLPEPGSFREIIAQYNLFTPYLEVFRIPITQHRIPWEYWQACILITSVLWVLALVVFGWFRKRIAFWI